MTPWMAVNTVHSTLNPYSCEILTTTRFKSSKDIWIGRVHLTGSKGDHAVGAMPGICAH